MFMQKGESAVTVPLNDPFNQDKNRVAKNGAHISSYF